MKESDFRARLLSMKTQSDRVKFIRKNVLGLTQTQLSQVIAARTGETLSRGAIGNWEHGGGMNRVFESALCELAECSLEWLIDGKGIDPGQLKDKQTEQLMLGAPKIGAVEMSDKYGPQKLNLVQPDARNRNYFIPVYGASLMSMEGRVLLGSRPVTHISASAIIEEDVNAYAFYVADNLMWPRAKTGDVGYAYPSRPAPDGSHVMIRMKPDSDNDGEEYGIFRLLVESQEREFIVATHNPEREYKIPRERVLAVHRVPQVSER